MKASQIFWLIAEDDEDEAFLLRSCCRRLLPPPALSIFMDGAKAVDFLSQTAEAVQPPTLIISDLKMPNLDGFEFLAWVKGQSRFRQVPFVILTNSNLELDRSKARALGADEYLVKPPTLEELEKMLLAVLNRWCPPD